MTNREELNKLIREHLPLPAWAYEDEIANLLENCSQHYEARIKELEDALNACNLMCDFSSIPAIEKAVKQALTDKG